MMLAGCEPIGPTDFSPPENESASTFRAPREPDRFGARFDAKVQAFAQDLAHQYGRFGSPEGVEMSPDRRTILIAVRDHPSTCLCDRERGVTDAGTMVAVVERSSETEPKVTRLFERERSGDPVIAISDRTIAVAQFSRLRIWARGALDAPAEHPLELSPRQLLFTDDGARLVAIGYGDVEVLDATAGFNRVARWKVPGYVRAAAVQPGGVLVLQVDERWIPYRLDGRIARSL
jgi:hypothetical protein